MGWFRDTYDKGRRSVAHSLPDAVRQRIAAAPAYGRAASARADGNEDKAQRFERLGRKFLEGKGKVPRYK